MSARILDGRVFASGVRADLVAMAQADNERFGGPAGLAIVRAGANASANIYTRSLLNVSAEVGVSAHVIDLEESIDDAALRAAIEALNADEGIHGILMSLPLPPHLSQRTVAEAMEPRKDVDGISLRSAGNLFLRLPSFVPSTCAAVVEMLDRAEISIKGKRVVIVGASNVVGKPLAFMLLHRDATVTVCHIYTADLAAWTRQADILIVAVGRPGLVMGDMVRPGATVVDVGINVLPDNSVVGDVDFASVAEVAGAVSPVPGGVGRLTNLMLLKQTFEARRLVATGALG